MRSMDHGCVCVCVRVCACVTVCAGVCVCVCVSSLEWGSSIPIWALCRIQFKAFGVASLRPSGQGIWAWLKILFR